MHNTGEIMQLCRLCLVKEQVNVPIFEGQGDVRQIFQKISSCLPVKINRSDKLPKNICDGCSEKLDLFYDFWNTSVNSEKQLLEWLGQTPLSAGAGTTIAAKNSTTKPTDPVQQIKVDVKQEPSDHTDNNESFQAEAAAMADDDEFKEESAPPPKRARRAVTKRKPITVAPDSDDDDDDDYEPVEPLTKLEDESGNSDNDNDNDNEDDSFAAPSTSADDQPGPSGLGKDGVEAPYDPDIMTPILTITDKAKTKLKGSLGNVIKKKRGRPKKSFDAQPIKKEIKEEMDSEEGGRKKTPEERKKAVEERLRKKEYRLKLKEEEDNIRTVSCPICKDDVERTLKELKEHYKENHEGKRLRTTKYSSEQNPCDVCGKCFKSTVSLRDHMETHNNYFHCVDCNVAYKKIVDYMIHLRTHSDEGLFRCLLCEFVTPEINDITSHVNLKHEKLEEGQKYWCGSCKKGFHIYSWFMEHDNYHSGLKPFDCELCGKCFMYSRHLHAHKNAMHKNETSEFPSLHMCVICKKTYSHRNSLKLHMNSHTGNYAICHICGKILSSKEKLKFHIRTHTGYKPFKCPYCEKSFTKKPILVEHIRIHTGERPYVCEYCTKSFSQRSSLVIHIRSHTGERPYVCHVCHKGFVAKAMLNIHLKACKGIFA